MSKDIIQGNWNEVKTQVRQQWANLNESDISSKSYTREELSGLIQKTYGYQKDRVEKEIDSFITKHGYNKTQGNQNTNNSKHF